MALLLAIVTALFLGASDFCAARAARTTPSMAVTRTVVGVSALLSPLLLPIVDHEWILRDIVIGGLSGVAMLTGLAMLYRDYAVARMGIVAPTSSVLLAAVPVVIGIGQGQRPGALAASGMAIGLAALVLTTYQPGGTGSSSLGIILGLSSGVAFGVAFTLMGEVSETAGLVPVLVQRGVGFVMLSTVAAAGRGPWFATGRGLRWAAVGGALSIIAIASLQLAFQRGDSGPVAVAASQFATVAVLLSVRFNRERMRSWQGIGVAATAVGVALMALGT